MRIALGSDHAGFDYKEMLKPLLVSRGHEVRDFGTHSTDPVDYPLFIRPAAEAVARGECARGIVLGGSGNGEAIAANKVRRIRCALCWNEQTARWARQHNDANMLSLGQRTISGEMAVEIVRIWLETPFEGGRHARRVALIEPAQQTVAVRWARGKNHRVKSLTEHLWFEMPSRRGYENITETVEGLVRKSGVQEGLCLVNAMHITASVYINDAEDGLLYDYDVWLEKLAPHEPVGQYQHNRTGEDNADAHLKRQVMGREVVVAITKGKLDLGPWEQIFYGEFDGRRRKRVLVKILGE